MRVHVRAGYKCLAAKVALHGFEAQVLIRVAAQLGRGGKGFGAQVTPVGFHRLVGPVVGLKVGLTTEAFAALVTVEAFGVLLMNEDMLAQLVNTARRTQKIRTYRTYQI